MKRGQFIPSGLVVLLVTVIANTALTLRVFAWGGLPHQQIVDGALTAIPAGDRFSLRLGPEARHLRDTVEMGDWMNSLNVVQENWHVATEDYPQIESEYFGKDYLLFPAAPHFFNHMMPQVHGTYRPFFLRALQALRTENRFDALHEQVPLNQSFFPLGDWRQPRSNKWDGFARFSRQGEGLIVLFRNGAQEATAHVAIPGFPKGAFRAKVWDSKQAFSWNGEQLRSGIEIPLSGADAEVLEVRRGW